MSSSFRGFLAESSIFSTVIHLTISGVVVAGISIGGRGVWVSGTEVAVGEGVGDGVGVCVESEAGGVAQAFRISVIVKMIRMVFFIFFFSLKCSKIFFSVRF